MNKKERLFNNAYLIFGILCILYYLGMGIAVRFGQSLLFLWPMLGVVCLLRWFLWKRAWKSEKHAPIPKIPLRLLRIVICLGLAFFLFVEGFICSGAFHSAPEGLDAVIVLGARVNEDGPSGALKQRAAAAADYLLANPDTIAVASGGQGKDEPQSEASCIRELMIEAGVEPERILLEEESLRTAENMKNSFSLLDGKAEEIGLVTNSFHIFRALCIGHKVGGYTLYGVPAETTVSGFIHYAMREFFAIVIGTMRGELAFSGA